MLHASTSTTAPSPATELSRSVERHVVLLLLGTYFAASFWPAVGQAIRATNLISVPLPLLMLAILLFLSGFGVDNRQFQVAFRWRWLLIAAQFALWGVPWTTVWLFRQLPATFPPGLLAGLWLVALMPTAASSVAWSQLCGGNQAVSVGLLAFSTLLSPFLIAALWRFDIAANGELGATDTAVAALIGWVVPVVVLGGIIRWRTGEQGVQAIRPYMKLFSTGLLLILNYANASVALPQVLADMDWQLMTTLAAVTLIVCGTGFCVGRLVTHLVCRESSVASAVVLGAGLKNTGMAIVLAGLWLETQPLAVVTIIFYTLTQHLLAAFYHRRVSNQ